MFHVGFWLQKMLILEILMMTGQKKKFVPDHQMKMSYYFPFAETRMNLFKKQNGVPTKNMDNCRWVDYLLKVHI